MLATVARGAAVAIALSAFMFPAAAEPLIGRASVIDGDTIEIHGERIRLEGIDAPESRQICTAKTADKLGQVGQVSGQVDEKLPCGRRAAFFLADLIGERPVTCTPDGRDRYRRVLAHCAVGGEDIGRAMVRAGWALASSGTAQNTSATREPHGRPVPVYGQWSSSYLGNGARAAGANRDLGRIHIHRSQSMMAAR